MKKTAPKGYPYRSRKVLVIDLTEDEYYYSPLEESVSLTYHGGRALAYKLWDDYVDWSSLNEESLYVGAPIIISLGAASDIGCDFATSSTIITYSLESNSVVSFNFSSKKFALSLSSLGFSALVIKGRSRRLTCLSIRDNDVEINICENFHNLNTDYIASSLIKASSVISIGSPGEEAIDYASINIDSQNVGRCGIGATFGAKNLKCIALYDEDNKKRSPYFNKLIDEITPYFKDKKTVNFLDYANRYGWGAIEGYKYRYDPRLWGLESDLTEDGDSDWLIALALGANLGIFDYEKVEELKELCLSLGLDPYSVSNYLIWLVAAEEEKILDIRVNKDLEPLERYKVILEYLAKSKGHFPAFNESVKKLTRKFGFKDKNFSSCNKEILPLDLRGLKAFALATALDDDTITPWELFKPLNKKKVAKALFTAQVYREICESLGISWKSVLYLANLDCKINRDNNKFIKILTDVFAIAEGYKKSEEDLIAFGKRSFFHRRKIEEKSKERVEYSISNIPVYFLTNEQSNYKGKNKEKVVSVGAQLDEYLLLVKYEKEGLNL